MPPTIPVPSHIIQIWWRYTPSAEKTSPPHQQHAATNPALRGPARSSHPPQTAAAAPRKTKKRVYIHPNSLIFQSQVVANTRARNDMSAGQATDCVMPMARESGNQNTLNPYAMPMQRWIAKAAGGTSQRLKCRPAMILSLASRPSSPLPVRTPSAAVFAISPPNVFYNAILCPESMEAIAQNSSLQQYVRLSARCG